MRHPGALGVRRLRPRRRQRRRAHPRLHAYGARPAHHRVRRQQPQPAGVARAALLPEAHVRHQGDHRARAAHGGRRAPLRRHLAGPRARIRHGRPHGQLLARLQRRHDPALPPGLPLRRRGAARGHQHPAMVRRQVPPHHRPPLAVRRGGHGQGRPGALLPVRHRRHPHAQGVQHRPGQGAHGPLHAGVHQVPPQRLRAPARRAHAGHRRAYKRQEAEDDDHLPAPPEEAGERGGGGGAGQADRVRGGDRGPAVQRGRGRLRAGGERRRRAHGGARRRAHQLALPADGGGVHPGEPVRQDGAHRGGGLRDAGGGHGAQVHGLLMRHGGEHAGGHAGARPPGGQGPGVDPPQRVEQGGGVLPRQAGREARPPAVRARAPQGHGHAQRVDAPSDQSCSLHTLVAHTH